MGYKELLDDFNIDYLTEGHKHCRPGWANMPCPFCTGHEGRHLGLHIESGVFFCWRCGAKDKIKTWSKILGVSTAECISLLRKYKYTKSPDTKDTNKKIKIKPFKLPSNTGALMSQHKIYLKNRKFIPAKLERDWGLLGTGPVSHLDKINYSNRIVIPIFWEGQQVSFQTRDITGKSNLRYISCPETREIIKHKHILYGRQDKWDSVGICVEGVFDVWRFGFSAFCTFGIQFTNRQIRQIKKYFKRVIVVYDDDPQAIEQGKLLVQELLVRGVDAAQEIIQGDPADMPQAEADKFVKHITKKIWKM